MENKSAEYVEIGEHLVNDALPITTQPTDPFYNTFTRKISNVVNCVKSGTVVTYTIYFKNTGNKNLSNVVITDKINDNLNYISNSASDSGTYSSSNKTVRWIIPIVLMDVEYSVTFKVRVKEVENVIVTNSAFINGYETNRVAFVVLSECIGDSFSNSLKTFVTDIGGSTVNVNGRISYNIYYINSSLNTYTNVSIFDIICPDVTIDIDTISNGGKYLDGVITWSGLTIGPGEFGNLTFDVYVNEDGRMGYIVENYAIIGGYKTNITQVTVNEYSEKQVKTPTPIIVSPISTEWFLEAQGVVLKWSYPIEKDVTQKRFILQVTKDTIDGVPDFSKTFLSIIQNITITEYIIPDNIGFSENGVYYWRIKGLGESPYTVYSNWSSIGKLNIDSVGVVGYDVDFASINNESIGSYASIYKNATVINSSNGDIYSLKDINLVGLDNNRKNLYSKFQYYSMFVDNMSFYIKNEIVTSETNKYINEPGILFLQDNEAKSIFTEEDKINYYFSRGIFGFIATNVIRDKNTGKIETKIDINKTLDEFNFIDFDEYLNSVLYYWEEHGYSGIETIRGYLISLAESDLAVKDDDFIINSGDDPFLFKQLSEEPRNIPIGSTTILSEGFNIKNEQLDELTDNVLVFQTNQIDDFYPHPGFMLKYLLGIDKIVKNHFSGKYNYNLSGGSGTTTYPYYNMLYINDALLKGKDEISGAEKIFDLSGKIDYNLFENYSYPYYTKSGSTYIKTDGQQNEYKSEVDKPYVSLNEKYVDKNKTWEIDSKKIGRTKLVCFYGDKDNYKVYTPLFINRQFTNNETINDIQHTLQGIEFYDKIYENIGVNVIEDHYSFSNNCNVLPILGGYFDKQTRTLYPFIDPVVEDNGSYKIGRKVYSQDNDEYEIKEDLSLVVICSEKIDRVYNGKNLSGAYLLTHNDETHYNFTRPKYIDDNDLKRQDNFEVGYRVYFEAGNTIKDIAYDKFRNPQQKPVVNNSYGDNNLSLVFERTSKAAWDYHEVTKNGFTSAARDNADNWFGSNHYTDPLDISSLILEFRNKPKTNSNYESKNRCFTGIIEVEYSTLGDGHFSSDFYSFARKNLETIKINNQYVQTSVYDDFYGGQYASPSLYSKFSDANNYDNIISCLNLFSSTIISDNWLSRYYRHFRIQTRNFLSKHGKLKVFTIDAPNDKKTYIMFVAEIDPDNNDTDNIYEDGIIINFPLAKRFKFNLNIIEDDDAIEKFFDDVLSEAEDIENRKIENLDNKIKTDYNTSLMPKIDNYCRGNIQGSGNSCSILYAIDDEFGVVYYLWCRPNLNIFTHYGYNNNQIDYSDGIYYPFRDKSIYTDTKFSNSKYYIKKKEIAGIADDQKKEHNRNIAHSIVMRLSTAILNSFECNSLGKLTDKTFVGKYNLDPSDIIKIGGADSPPITLSNCEYSFILSLPDYQFLSTSKDVYSKDNANVILDYNSINNSFVLGKIKQTYYDRKETTGFYIDYDALEYETNYNNEKNNLREHDIVLMLPPFTSYNRGRLHRLGKRSYPWVSEDYIYGTPYYLLTTVGTSRIRNELFSPYEVSPTCFRLAKLTKESVDSYINNHITAKIFDSPWRGFVLYYNNTSVNNIILHNDKLQLIDDKIFNKAMPLNTNLDFSEYNTIKFQWDTEDRILEDVNINNINYTQLVFNAYAFSEEDVIKNDGEVFGTKTLENAPNPYGEYEIDFTNESENMAIWQRLTLLGGKNTSVGEHGLVGKYIKIWLYSSTSLSPEIYRCKIISSKLGKLVLENIDSTNLTDKTINWDKDTNIGIVLRFEGDSYLPVSLVPIIKNTSLFMHFSYFSQYSGVNDLIDYKKIVDEDDKIKIEDGVLYRPVFDDKYNKIGFTSSGNIRYNNSDIVKYCSFNFVEDDFGNQLTPYEISFRLTSKSGKADVNTSTKNPTFTCLLEPTNIENNLTRLDYDITEPNFDIILNDNQKELYSNLGLLEIKNAESGINIKQQTEHNLVNDGLAVFSYTTELPYDTYKLRSFNTFEPIRNRKQIDYSLPIPNRTFTLRVNDAIIQHQSVTNASINNSTVNITLNKVDNLYWVPLSSDILLDQISSDWLFNNYCYVLGTDLVIRKENEDGDEVEYRGQIIGLTKAVFALDTNSEHNLLPKFLNTADEKIIFGNMINNYQHIYTLVLVQSEDNFLEVNNSETNKIDKKTPVYFENSNVSETGWLTFHYSMNDKIYTDTESSFSNNVLFKTQLNRGNISINSIYNTIEKEIDYVNDGYLNTSIDLRDPRILSRIYGLTFEKNIEYSNPTSTSYPRKFPIVNNVKNGFKYGAGINQINENNAYRHMHIFFGGLYNEFDFTNSDNKLGIYITKKNMRSKVSIYNVSDKNSENRITNYFVTFTDVDKNWNYNPYNSNQSGISFESTLLDSIKKTGWNRLQMEALFLNDSQNENDVNYFWSAGLYTKELDHKIIKIDNTENNIDEINNSLKYSKNSDVIINDNEVQNRNMIGPLVLGPEAPVDTNKIGDFPVDGDFDEVPDDTVFYYNTSIIPWNSIPTNLKSLNQQQDGTKFFSTYNIENDVIIKIYSSNLTTLVDNLRKWEITIGSDVQNWWEDEENSLIRGKLFFNPKLISNLFLVKRVFLGSDLFNENNQQVLDNGVYVLLHNVKNIRNNVGVSLDFTEHIKKGGYIGVYSVKILSNDSENVQIISSIEGTWTGVSYNSTNKETSLVDLNEAFINIENYEFAPFNLKNTEDNLGQYFTYLSASTHVNVDISNNNKINIKGDYSSSDLLDKEYRISNVNDLFYIPNEEKITENCYFSLLSGLGYYDLNNPEYIYAEKFEINNMAPYLSVVGVRVYNNAGLYTDTYALISSKISTIGPGPVGEGGKITTFDLLRVTNYPIEIINTPSKALGYDEYRNMVGEYESEILVADSDFAFWKLLYWEQELIGNIGNEENTSITLEIRTASSETELLSKQYNVDGNGIAYSPYTISNWDYPHDEYIKQGINIMNYSTDGTILQTGDVTKFRYLQFRVKLYSKIKNTPRIRNVRISYSTKESEVFFTKRFILRDNIRRGILTVNQDIPDGAVVEWGINTSGLDFDELDFTKYQIIPTDEVFEVENKDSQFRLAARIVSSGDSIPYIYDFGFMFDEGSTNETNQDIETKPEPPV